MDYFDVLKKGLDDAYAHATEAREKGLDPENFVEVKVTKDVAARVEGIVGPPGIANVIREKEKQGKKRELVAFEIAREIAQGKHIKAPKEFLVEQAVRTGVGILTEGVLVAPTEGIARVKVKNNPDGSDYVAVYYAGPIRSAGGTAAALSVLLADAARKELKIGDYRPTDSQIERYVEEVNIYEARVTHLQYKPSDEDIRHIVKHCPVCVDGDPTEEIEVSAYRGIPGVETNRVRGGIPLVICEGIAQKAAKLFSYTKKVDLNWDWLEKVIKIKRKEKTVEIKPDGSYLDGLVAGRPVFAYPSEKGGFRLRYGRSRTNGIMGKNIHSATMILLDGFLAYGTHMKIERPGKGCVVCAHEGLEPPVVKLKDGSVKKIKTLEQAEEINEDVDSILFLGDILVPYGDFRKSNHPLLPPGFCKEWWVKEVEAKGINPHEKMNAKEAFEFSKEHGVPLYPEYTFHWHDISSEELKKLAEWISGSGLLFDGDSLKEIALKDSEEKEILEKLLIEHNVANGKIFIDGEYGYSLVSSLGLLNEKTVSLDVFNKIYDPLLSSLELVNKLSGIKIKAKSPTYIGGRMGRPEKAKERKMDGSPNVLFPTGSQKLRSVSKLHKTLKAKQREKTVNLELVRFRCKKCSALSFYRKCIVCGEDTLPERVCTKCRASTTDEKHCGRATALFERRPVDIVEIYDKIRENVGNSGEVKGVRGLSNAWRMPERLEKGFFRSKYDVYVFRDGTSRFDATDAPLTHFTPKELGVSISKLKELGYEEDVEGKPITSDEQTIPLKVQDIVLSDSGADYFVKVAKFIDDMLVNLYGIKPFYNVEKREDLIGHLASGLSPHTSATVLCRIIGFTKAHVGYAHPYFHTGKRRNCDGDEDSIMLLMDALLNFSRRYLDEKRGGTMDSPLVLTPKLDPKEVDDEVHEMEFVNEYPLEFYHAAEEYSSPGSVKLRRIGDVLGTPEQYGEIPVTHPGGFLDKGVTRTSYVTLQSIPEKISVQFELQKKIKSVDTRDAAERLILSHFIPDLYGNLRSYSRQTFRCVDCNHIYRRVPLIGKCSRCGGNLLLTINKGGIEKYLQISRDISEEYDLPDYLKQRLELIEREIKSIFEDEKVKQLALADFV